MVRRLNSKLQMIWTIILSSLLCIVVSRPPPTVQRSSPVPTHRQPSSAPFHPDVKRNRIQKREQNVPSIKDAPYAWQIPTNDGARSFGFAATQQGFSQRGDKADGYVILGNRLTQGSEGGIFPAAIKDRSGADVYHGVGKLANGPGEVWASLLQRRIHSVYVPDIRGIFYIPEDNGGGHSLAVMQTLSQTLYDILQEVNRKERTYFDPIFPLLHVMYALRDAHAAQVAHVDVKPQNVMVDDSELEWKLIDWGLAQDMTKLWAAVKAGKALLPFEKGTEGYMAPAMTGKKIK